MTNRYPSAPGFTRSDITPEQDDFEVAEEFRAGRVRYVTDSSGTRVLPVKDVWRGHTDPKAGNQ